MSDDDKKITDLTEHRKKKLPVAQTGLRDVNDIMAELIETMQAREMKYLIGCYMGGWTFSIKRDSDTSGDHHANR